MGEPRVLVPKTAFGFQLGTNGLVSMPIGSPVDVTAYAGGELAVMLYDRGGLPWESEATITVSLVNALWSSDAPTMVRADTNSASTAPATAVINADTPDGTLVRCGLSDYNALGAMVQPVMTVFQGAYSGLTYANLSVMIDCSGRQPVAPYLMPGLTAWYRGDRCRVVGNEVQGATDLSGRGVPLQLAVGSNAPTYVETALNGCPGILFDGAANNIMKSQSALTLSTYTIFSVFRASSPNSIVYDHGTGDGSYLYTTNTPTLDTKRSGITSAKAWNANWGIDNVNRIVREEYGGTHATQNLCVNGTRLGLVTAYGLNNDPGFASVTLTLYVGGRTGNVLPMTGHLMELIVFSPMLSEYDAQRLERFYLGPRYGISVA